MMATLMKSQRISRLPIRLRPWFLLFTLLVMLFLAFLGFTNAVPLNTKLLHFACFCIATGVFYFIFDIDEDARRIWFWRHANLAFTLLVCFFFGGFVSELVESILPNRHFDPGDVVANVLGSTLGLFTSYHIEKRYRSRREIARLYRPLDTDDHFDPDDYSDNDAGPSGTQLLPLFNSSFPKSSLPSAKAYKAHRLADVWDEREDLFGIGDDSDSEDPPVVSRPVTSPHPVPTITLTRP